MLWSEKSRGLDIEGAIVAIATATLSSSCPCAATSHHCTARKSHSGIQTSTNAPCRRATFCLVRSLSECCPKRPTCLTASKCPMEADIVHSRLGNTTTGWWAMAWLRAVFWVDAATFHTRDQMYLVLMNIMTKRGHGEKRHWICSSAKKVVCACGCFVRWTYDAVFVVLCWSFCQLLAGKCSSVRDDGKNFKSYRWSETPGGRALLA